MSENHVLATAIKSVKAMVCLNLIISYLCFRTSTFQTCKLLSQSVLGVWGHHLKCKFDVTNKLYLWKIVSSFSLLQPFSYHLILDSWVWPLVSLSVSRSINIWETAHSFFLKFCMKFGVSKGNKWHWQNLENLNPMIDWKKLLIDFLTSSHKLIFIVNS